ncbi:hypothetical protein E2562_020961 [Oryza meyeriana var. granulata]|uniref:DUF1618 domain-containing protein n=1 Tax=Oryza meyeriana var. granulata TaxID=110450 RepID=A0A6G1DYL1_9ORYZ|nr:hypothetical protein E2562_020961 [Oryza meyeriana var. granulata]
MGCASDGAAPKVSMRTLVDPETGMWTLEYAVSFADIWASESYKATKLPEKAAALALIHPKNRTCCTSSWRTSSSASTCAGRRSWSTRPTR